ncbi:MULTISPECIES: Rv2175c family DNA-binding protein [Brevibacterium]|uniref:Rv2175c family DNA-binding protein n=1 Tax=Brevibacterium salitolerans TaxID=1403566 RepID=A0ABN2X8A4_9MICO|nr:Rv2175c family DNA-binding protein [Brevibacterium sp.]
MNRTDELVDAWLPLPDIAERSGLGISKVRRFVEERAVIGLRRGERSVFQVPELFLDDDCLPVKHLKGTLITLQDAGFDDEAAIAWLFTPDDSLPGRPIDLLRAGNKTEIRRRAQALAF